jgi:hypothetical protein
MNHSNVRVECHQKLPEFLYTLLNWTYRAQLGIYSCAVYTFSSYHADDSCIGLVYYVPVMDPVNARSRLPKVFIDTDVIRRPNEAI